MGVFLTCSNDNVYFIFDSFRECGEVFDHLEEKYEDAVHRLVLKRVTPLAWQSSPISF